MTEIENVACPGAGACGGQYTANTMALAMEFLGLAAFGSAGIPAVDPRKNEISRGIGTLIVEMVRNDIRPSSIMTREAFENAIAGVAATGGSSNAVLHLLAIAQEAGVPLTIDDFDAHPHDAPPCLPTSSRSASTSQSISTRPVGTIDRSPRCCSKRV